MQQFRKLDAAAMGEAELDAVLADIAPQALGEEDWQALFDTLDQIAARVGPRGGEQSVEAGQAPAGRGTVVEVEHALRETVRRGDATATLLTNWRYLLVTERYGITPAHEERVPQLRWKIAPPPRLQRLLDGIDVEIVATLGREAAGAVLTGPRHTRILIGKDAVHDALEAELLVYHLYLHSLTDLPIGGFGCWIEYRHDPDAERYRLLLADADYREHEAWINDTVTCLMFDEYAAIPTTPPPGESILRDALRRHAAGNPVLRTLFDERGRLRHEIRAKLATVYVTTAATQFAAMARPHAQFRQHIAVVHQATSGPISLIWADEHGRWRRWIPSRKVLTALGLRLADVALIGDLSSYRYDGVLVAPDDVAQVESALLHAVDFALLPRPGSSAGRLAGLAKQPSSFALPSMRREGRMELIDTHSGQHERALATV